MMERNYKLPKEGGLEPGADPADIIRKFEKIYTNIYENEASGAAYVAREIADCIREKQSIGEMCVLGITTGKSPVGVFRALVELHRSEGLSFRNVVVFSLDEFFPITPEELQSRNYSIHESLLDLVDIAPENIHIPDGTLPQDEVAAFCREYESKIEEYDGIDLMILGTGVQGQIGFNEPGSYTNTRTRLVALGNESRKSAASIFYGIDYVPHKAITMGLGTILGAKRIILIAWGEEKAQVIKDTVEGEKQLIVPATCLQDHPNVEVVVDEGASSQLTRVKTPWLVGRCLWPSRFIRTAVLWLCEQVRKPILKLTYQDYVDNRLGQLLEISGMAYDEINIQVFNDLQHTITGWPGGKPNADDSTRPERAFPYPKRVVIFSPHPDDDVISMGGTFRRLITQGHDVHVAYETSGNIAVHDDVVLQTIDTARECGFEDKYDEVKRIIAGKRKGEPEPLELRKLKGSIRRAEAKAACRHMGLNDRTNVHFLNLPFYETGGVKKAIADRSGHFDRRRSAAQNTTASDLRRGRPVGPARHAPYLHRGRAGGDARREGRAVGQGLPLLALPGRMAGVGPRHGRHGRAAESRRGGPEASRHLSPPVAERRDAFPRRRQARVLATGRGAHAEHGQAVRPAGHGGVSGHRGIRSAEESGATVASRSRFLGPANLRAPFQETRLSPDSPRTLPSKTEKRNEPNKQT